MYGARKHIVHCKIKSENDLLVSKIIILINLWSHPSCFKTS